MSDWPEEAKDKFNNEIAKEKHWRRMRVFSAILTSAITVVVASNLCKSDPEGQAWARTFLAAIGGAAFSFAIGSRTK